MRGVAILPLANIRVLRNQGGVRNTSRRYDKVRSYKGSIENYRQVIIVERYLQGGVAGREAHITVDPGVPVSRDEIWSNQKTEAPTAEQTFKQASSPYFLNLESEARCRAEHPELNPAPRSI